MLTLAESALYAACLRADYENVDVLYDRALTRILDSRGRDEDDEPQPQAPADGAHCPTCAATFAYEGCTRYNGFYICPRGHVCEKEA